MADMDLKLDGIAGGILVEKTVKALEENYQKELEQIKESHDKEIQEFISSLESSEKNTKAFNEVLDKVLFA